jgi:hypothetical protein
MKKLVLLIMCVSLFIPLAATSVSWAEERSVLATGTAAGSDEKAKDEALSRALRDAVEKSVGIYVEADTMVKNYKLLEDKIYSQVKGYVKSYEVISDNKGEGGMYEIKIKAVVSGDVLENDLAGLDIIKSAKGNPRLVILINEYVDGVESATGTARSAVEKEFLGKNFKLIDKNQLTAVKNRDVSVSFEDPQKAASLGARLGAEVVITGSANAEFMEKSKPYGVSVYAYNAEINLKAIKTDTAEIMSVATVSMVKRGGGRSQVANDALTECSKQLSDKMMKEILEKWRSEIYNEMDVTIIISEIDSAARTAVLADLQKVRGIKEVQEKSYTNNVMELDAKVEGAASKVISDKILEQIKGLELTNKTANRLDFKFKNAIQKVTDSMKGNAVTTSEVKAEEVNQEEPKAEQPESATEVKTEEVTPQEEAKPEEAAPQEVGPEGTDINKGETETQEEKSL